MKYKFILHRFQTNRDTSGNVYSYFALADTRSGRVLYGRDVPESNAQGAMFILNGNQHKQNYWSATTTLSSRLFDYYVKDIPYIGCSPEQVASAFQKMMKSRKKKVKA
jgi:hypothetical protein